MYKDVHTAKIFKFLTGSRSSMCHFYHRIILQLWIDHNVTFLDSFDVLLHTFPRQFCLVFSLFRLVMWNRTNHFCMNSIYGQSIARVPTSPWNDRQWHHLQKSAMHCTKIHIFLILKMHQNGTLQKCLKPEYCRNDAKQKNYRITRA